jgi:hypothetical protein
MEPGDPELPPYLAPWANNLPAGELHPLIDELAFAPNTITEPPVAEFGEIIFGSDLHCGIFDPVAFGDGPPHFGWGPLCPNAQSAIPGNMGQDDWEPGRLVAPLNGTGPLPNRVAREGAAKVPHLRNIELTGPYFHTGSYLTLRQVVDFYMRGGDFPMTNAENRDPNLVDVDIQAFGFGSTLGLPPQFQDAVPDAISQYGPMPDLAPPGCFLDPPNCTPEPATSTPEEAKVALVKFLLALTDERLKFERAPFDRPEIFPPIDGTAPDNTGGRAQLLGLAATTCSGGLPATDNDHCFLHVPAVGAAGSGTPLSNFLGISSTPVGGDDNDHFDR